MLAKDNRNGIKIMNLGARTDAFKLPAWVAPGRHRSSGFTLIELLISSVLMAGILAAGYLSLRGAISGRDLVESRADTMQRARVAMSLITSDLRAATPLVSDSTGTSDFIGVDRMIGKVEADSIDFATHDYIPRRPHESDFCEVSWFVDKGSDGRMSLWRRRDPKLDSDPLAGGSREEVARSVAGVRFEFYDGWVWYDEWGSSSGAGDFGSGVGLSSYSSGGYGMPEAVRVTLLFASTEEESGNASRSSSHGPMAFQTVARLNLAGRPSMTSVGGESGGMTNQPTAETSQSSSRRR